jgi:hypothetical protein
MKSKKDCSGISFDDMNLNPGIKHLVEAINIRYSTHMSCEGHSDLGCPYPWIDLKTFQDYSYLNETLEKFNSSNMPTWILHDSHFNTEENIEIYRLMPESRVYGTLSLYRRNTMDPAKLEQIKLISEENISLKELQNSAKNLAEYLNKNWKKN